MSTPSDPGRSKRWLPWLLLGLSLLINVALGALLLNEVLCAPEDRVGILVKDTPVGEFGGSQVLFTLPKGLTVRNASPRFIAAAGQFEPNRFEIVVTSESDLAVDYSASIEKQHAHGEFYSIDLNGVVFNHPAEPSAR